MEIFTLHQKNRRKPLAGTFEQVLQRVNHESTSQTTLIIAKFAMSLLDSIEFDLSQINELSTTDQKLVMVMFDFCITEGLTEDERKEASVAFSPFLEIFKNGTRH